MDAAVILENSKFGENIAAAVRACACFGASRLHWTGTRVLNGPKHPRPKRGRERRLAERGFDDFGDVRFSRERDPLSELIAKGFTPVAVELVASSVSLDRFEHPEKAVYVFGPEDGNVSPQTLARCPKVVRIPSHGCLNVAAAVYVTLYDRQAKLASRQRRLRRVA